MTSIYELERAFKTYEFLCRLHVSRRRAQGWTAKKIGETPFVCADCETERQERERA